jgi:hypothetical protein
VLSGQRTLQLIFGNQRRESSVSVYFEAVVVAADQPALIRLLEGLPQILDPDPFAPLTLELYQVTDRGFVIFGWRAGARRPEAWQEVEDLADELSLELGPAVAVHYNDQVGVKVAMLSQEGEPVRYFGEQDEVWVPYGEDGKLVTDGPRYPGDALPEDIECDCIRNGIDAALEATGFQGWITARELVQVAYRKDPVWQRLGVPE